jgi:trehalose 6-phosphate synthase/phosphatase
MAGKNVGRRGELLGSNWRRMTIRSSHTSHPSIPRRSGGSALPNRSLTARGAAAAAPKPAGERRSAARLLIAAVRLPRVDAPAADPLVTALAPLGGERRSLWIGLPPPAAAPTAAPALAAAPALEPLGPGVAGVIQTGGAAQRPVDLSAEEERSCDDGLVQRALWPLFHDLAPLARFESADWQAFGAINRKFARAVAQVLARGTGGDLLWVQDPLLIGVAAALRRRRSPAAATFFLRLPFPAADAFVRLPWREALLAGLLAHRHVGFQTRRDLGNFLDAVQRIFPAVAVRPAAGAWELAGQSGARSCSCKAGVYPEGVDAAGIAAAAASPEVERQAAELRGALAGAAGHRIVLALDTLDAAQGTVQKLRAFAVALERLPALRGTTKLMLRLAPNRLAGTAALDVRREVERTVGEINGRLGKAGWVPVHYRFGEVAPGERLALYRAADVALATPLRAGMELTAKAYCAADVDERGILVLSEFAGAADQLRGAWLVNPHDIEATAQALAGALHARDEERRSRMRDLRAEVRRHDLGWWMRELLPEALAEPGRDE